MAWVTCSECDLKLIWVAENSLREVHYKLRCVRGHKNVGDYCVGKDTAIPTPSEGVEVPVELRKKHSRPEIPVRQDSYYEGVLERIHDLRTGMESSKEGSRVSTGQRTGKRTAKSTETTDSGKPTENESWTEVTTGE